MTKNQDNVSELSDTCCQNQIALQKSYEACWSGTKDSTIEII